MEAIKKKTHYTIAEYLTAETKADYKSEYYNGEIVAKTGNLPLHSEISVGRISVFIVFLCK